MIKITNRNAYAALFMLCMIAVLFISFWVMMAPYALVFNVAMNDSQYSGYVTEATCKGHGGSWDGVACTFLSRQAKDTIEYGRKAWLIAPIIVVIGLIIWLLTVASRRDPSQWYLRP
jgi:hypothetical protein